jgi:hypothetical protein
VVKSQPLFQCNAQSVVGTGSSASWNWFVISGTALTQQVQGLGFNFQYSKKKKKDKNKKQNVLG